MNSLSRFESLEQALTTATAPAKSTDYKGPPIRMSAHEECLAISWLADMDYWRGVEFERALKKQKDAPENKDVSSAKQRERGRDAVRKSYAHKRAGPYAFERMVFYKTSELVPNSLADIGAGTLSDFRAAPLHHYLVFAREQGPADPHAPLTFSAWQVRGRQFLEQGDVVKALVDELRTAPIKAEDVSRSRSGVWRYWLGAILAVSLVLAGGFGALSWLAPDVLDELLRSMP